MGRSHKLLRDRKYLTATFPHLGKYILVNARHFSIALPFYCSQNKIFNQIIPSTYISSKNKPILVLFYIYELNLTEFRNKIPSLVPKDCVYTVFVKVRYNIDNFFMAGTQFGFKYSHNEDIQNLFSVVISKLETYFDSYNLTEDAIVYIQVSFWQKDLRLFSEFYLDKSFHTCSDKNIITGNILSVPLSVNEDSIGKPLPLNISNGIITHIITTINGKTVNFLDVIKNAAKVLRASHIDNIINLDENFKFYLLKDKYHYVLAVKALGNNSIEKIRYSLSGVIISHITDNVVNDLILRNSGEKRVVIDSNNNKVVSIIQNIKLKAIERPYIKPLFVENNNIGVIDIETYRTDDNTYKVYALGFKTNLSEHTEIYYIDKDDLDSNKIILKLVNELLTSKYSNITFYCDNLGGYDIVYILKALYTYNENAEDKYKISCMLRNDRIIKVKISKDKNSFTILDSFAMLSSSLAELGTNFKVNTIKTQFPYKFAKQVNLFYQGVMPSIDNYKDITIEQYDNISVMF